MAFYNDLRFLPQAVQSILGQTFQDFEFLLIDDASSDGSADYIASLCDPRLRMFHNERNIGLTSSLCRGVREAQGTYIARMDADDIAFPCRLEEQVHFMRSNPEVGISGAACIEIDADGKRIGKRYPPKSDLSIRWTSLLNNPFIHPSIILRRAVITENQLNYDESFINSQDYEFWSRLLQYTRGANLTQPLIMYRMHPGQITYQQRMSQIQNHQIVALRTMRQLLPQFPIEPETLNELLAVFIGLGEAPLYLETRFYELADLYLLILESFIQSYTGSEQVRPLKHIAIDQIIRPSFHLPLTLNFGKLFYRLISLDLGSFIWVLSGFAFRRIAHMVNL